MMMSDRASVFDTVSAQILGSGFGARHPEKAESVVEMDPLERANWLVSSSSVAH